MLKWLKKRGIQFWFWMAWVVSFIVGGVIIFGMIGADAGFWAKLVDGPPDFLVTMDGPATVAPGAEATYTITIKNIGKSEGGGNNPIVTLPAGLTFVRSLPGEPACKHNNGILECKLGSQQPGDQGTLMVTAVADAGASGAKNVTVNIVPSGKTRDTMGEEISDNNSDAVSTTIQ